MYVFLSVEAIMPAYIRTDHAEDIDCNAYSINSLTNVSKVSLKVTMADDLPLSVDN